MTLVLPSALLLVLVAIEAFVLRVVQKKTCLGTKSCST